MTFSISAKIQDGSQNLVPKINAFLRFTQKFKMTAKSDGKAIFCEKSPVDSAYTVGVQNFVEIALPRTVSKINAFLHFTQKFKMAAKSGGKAIFAKSRQKTLHIPCGSKISSKSLYLVPFPRKMRFCILRRNSRWLPKVVGKRFLFYVPPQWGGHN